MTGIFRRASGLTHEFTGVEAAAAAGLAPDVAAQVWRAFGLPEINQESIPAYDEQDVETLRALGALLSAGIALPDLLAVARVYGQAVKELGAKDLIRALAQVFCRRYPQSLATVVHQSESDLGMREGIVRGEIS